MKFITRVKFRRATAALWTSNNPVLFEGEAGYETDTGKFKIGDGVTAWSSLAYSSGAKGDKGDTGAKGDQGIQGEAGPNQVSDATETTFANGVLISDGAGNVALIPFTGDTTKFLRDDGTMAVVGGVGAVSSVFGRTGAVVAVDGDYSQSKITGLKTSDSPMFTALNIGHASDTTLARVSPGVISLEGATVLVQGGALGTPLSGTLTNCTGLPAGGLSASATSRIFGRKTAGAGAGEELTLSEALDFVGSAAQGDILYRGASGWTRLAAGTSGYVLTSAGAGANPSWAAGGSGAVIEHVDEGIYLPGNANQRIISNVTTPAIGTNSFWIRIKFACPSSNPASDQGLFAITSSSTGSAAANAFTCYLSSAGYLYIFIYGSGGTGDSRFLYNTTFLSTYAGKTVDMVILRDAATPTASVWVNGVAVSFSTSTTGTPPAWSDSITSTYISVGNVGSSKWIGDIYAFQIGKGVITTGMVTQLLYAGCGTGTGLASNTPISRGGAIGGNDGLLLDTNFRAGFGSTYCDSSGNGITLASNNRDESHKSKFLVGSRGKSLLSDGTDLVWDYNCLQGFLANRSLQLCYMASTSTFAAIGDSLTGNGTGTASTGDANQPPMVNYASGAVAGNAAGFYGTTMTIARQQPKTFAIIRLVDTTAIRIWISVHDGGSTTGTNSDDPASRSLMGFRFSTDAGDTNWRCCTKDGTTLNNQDSGVAPSTSGVTVLEMENTGSSVKFYINGTLVATSSSNLPSSTLALRYQIYAETRTTAAKNIRIHSAGIIKTF